MACRATTGLGLWPWNGRLLVTTHGLCRSCLEPAKSSRPRAARYRLPERKVVSDLLN